MQTSDLENTIQPLWYNRTRREFTFVTYVKHHKMIYQAILSLAKKTNYVAYGPSMRVCHFLNSNTDPSFAQVKVPLNANSKKYSSDFDATVEYLMNQVLHQKADQHLNIANVGSSASKTLKTKDDKGQDLDMPVVQYPPEQWLSNAEKASMRKHYTPGCSAGHGNGGDCK